MKNLHETRTSLMVECSRGGASDVENFYCTTTATTYIPHTSADQKMKHPHLQTGYSKNCTPFVEYDPAIDETDYKFSKFAFLTSNRESYKPLVRPAQGEERKYAQMINHTAFSRKLEITGTFGDANPTEESEMKSHYNKNLHSVKDGSSFDLSKIIPSTSGFTSDQSRSKGYGTSTASPFEKPAGATVPVKDNHTVLMKDDGFTRSERGGGIIFNPDHLAAYNRIASRHPHADAEAKPQVIVVGKKQATGSIRSNKPFVATHGFDPKAHFQTETSARFTSPEGKFPNRGVECDLICESGFTASNRVQQAPVLAEQTLMHPVLHVYHSKKQKQQNASRPTAIHLATKLFV